MTGKKFWRATPFVAGTTLISVLGAVWVFGQKNENQDTPRVALIGDSYAVGLGPELKKLLPEFDYEGREGSNTWQWAHDSGCGRCMGWLASFRPQIVLVSLGTNDGSVPNLENYQSIVRWIHGIGARIIWIEPPSSVSTASRGVIADLGVQTIPATSTPLASDRLHPISYAPWAREIANAIAGSRP